MYTILLPGLCFKYDNKKVAHEVFHVLCTTYEHNARIILQKNGKEVQYAVIEKDRADYQVVKTA